MTHSVSDAELLAARNRVKINRLVRAEIQKSLSSLQAADWSFDEVLDAYLRVIALMRPTRPGEDQLRQAVAALSRYVYLHDPAWTDAEAEVQDAMRLGRTLQEDTYGG
jgi:hypothetical protein